MDTIQAGTSPYDISATPEADKMVFTDYIGQDDAGGFGVITGSVNGSRTVT